MKVTLFERRRQTEITNIEWTDLMQKIRSGYWRKIVEKCRAEQIGLDEMRRRLPAFGISVTFIGGDAAANMVKYTHIVGIDFNKIFINNAIANERISECRRLCEQIPSVVGFYTTKSGRGFRIFVKVNTGIAQHRAIYHPLQQYFEKMLQLQADDKYQFITRLSFVSADEDCFYRSVEEAEPFDLRQLIPGTPQDEAQEMSDVELKVVNYLSHKYDFRYNLLERVSQFRVSGNQPAVEGARRWHDINDRYSDAMAADVHENCTPITYNQFEWIRRNQVIEPYYDPVDDFTASLPEWDGEDRLAGFCDQIADSDTRLREWVKAMMQRWIDPKAPLLPLAIVSEKADTGKTDWAQSLMPPQLRMYMAASSVNFLYGLSKQKLLFIFEDFSGSQADINRVRYLRACNPRAAMILLSDQKKLDQYIARHGKEKFLLVKVQQHADINHDIDYQQLYAQVMG